MLVKTVFIFVILGTVGSEPIKRSIIIPDDITSVLNDYVQQLELSMRPETVRSIRNLVKSAVGFKLSAIEIAMKGVHWLTSNFIGIALGGIIALGICKITGKCSMGYDHTFSKLYSVLTTERLEMAQNLFVNAIRTFGEGDKEEVENIEEEAEDGKEEPEDN